MTGLQIDLDVTVGMGLEDNSKNFRLNCSIMMEPFTDLEKSEKAENILG